MQKLAFQLKKLQIRYEICFEVNFYHVNFYFTDYKNKLHKIKHVGIFVLCRMWVVRKKDIEKFQNLV